MKPLGLVLFYGCCYGIFGWWTENTDAGKYFKHFCQTWKADSFLHGVLCSVTVFIFGVCGILALGLLFKVMGV